MKKWTAGMVLILVFLAIGMFIHETAAETSPEKGLYVSPNGSDKNPGSKQKPFKTIQKAADSAKPGTVVYVRKGIYKEQVVIRKSGTKNAPIILKSYNKEKAVLDGTSLKANWDHQGLISIHNKSYITIAGFEVRNYKTRNEELVPIGISVSGSGKGIRILQNHVQHIETAHENGNAHGIAVYGTEAPEAIEDIEISENLVEDLKLGWSEAIVLNGNVVHFTVTDNTVRQSDNIGIDMIGFEGTSPREAYDQARNGLVSHNTVSQISSYGNPAYGPHYTAGGIYVDGGKDITIEENRVYQNDIGIEAASEHKGKSTSGIKIRKNIIFENKSAGIAIGGYDEERGNTVKSLITDNVLYKNDREYQDGGQLLIQYNAKHNIIQNNIMVAGESSLLISSPFRESEGNSINNNMYYVSGGEKKTRWIWEEKEISGFSEYQKKSRQESNSVFQKPEFIDEGKKDFRLAK
jgi:Right handed beta helix region